MNFRLKTFATFLYERKASVPKAPKKERDAPVFQEPHADSPLRISTRVPTTANGRGKSGRGLDVSYDAMKQDHEHVKKTADLIRGYGVLPQHMTGGSDHEVLEHFVNHAADNLVHLHHEVQKQGWANDAEKWYDGAHTFTKGLAEKYNIPHQSVAAVTAAMSPQKDWHQNASLAERVLDHYHTKQDHAWTPEMEKTATKILKPSKKQKEKGGEGDLVAIHNAIRGKKLGELTDPDHKAAWIRTYDEAHEKRAYHVLSPTGEKTGYAMTNADAKGRRSTKKAAWGSIGEISKAVSSIESKGDVEHISDLMGNRHKVRSFYNNIIHPNSSHGDLTSDTHHVAASLLSPLSGNSVPVAHNFKNSLESKHRPKNGEWGGWHGASGSAKTGIHGTYALFHEAGRRAAERLGIEQGRHIHPRQVQSVVWEGVRGLFTKEQKSDPKFVDGVNKIWHGHANGEYDADTARSKIYEHAGGIKKPEWVKG